MKCIKNEIAKFKIFRSFVDEQYGKKGTPKRDKLEAGFDKFKLEVILKLKGVKNHR